MLGSCSTCHSGRAGLVWATGHSPSPKTAPSSTGPPGESRWGPGPSLGGTSALGFPSGDAALEPGLEGRKPEQKPAAGQWAEWQEARGPQTCHDPFSGGQSLPFPSASTQAQTGPLPASAVAVLP